MKLTDYIISILRQNEPARRNNSLLVIEVWRLDGWDGFSPIPTHLWSEARMQNVLNAIEDRFGVGLERAAAREIETFADLAEAVQNALWERQGHAGGP